MLTFPVQAYCSPACLSISLMLCVCVVVTLDRIALTYDPVVRTTAVSKGYAASTKDLE